MKNGKTIVLSVGGSLVAPKEGIDERFLKKFRSLILTEVKKGNRFLIAVGGGRTARDYIKAAGAVARVADEDKDWLGIHATRLNAHLLRTVFREVAYPKIIKNPKEKISSKNEIFIAAGWKPGWSTDYVAVMLARENGIKTLANLSNIDGVYDRDPKKFAGAKLIEKIGWKDFRKIVGNRWSPGLSAPFDPVAAREAQKAGMKVIVLNGKDFKNLKNCLDGKKFKGTEIC